MTDRRTCTGQPNVYYVKLNEDMISYSGDIVKVDPCPSTTRRSLVLQAQRQVLHGVRLDLLPRGIGYAMSDSPTGPWTTKGYIMRPTDRSRGNHPGIIDYKGKTYVFGLNYDLLRIETPDHHERRSVSAAEMHYNADGTIQEVPYWKDTRLEPVGTFNPYRRVQAETMAWGYGLKTAPRRTGGICVTNIHNGETLRLRAVDVRQPGGSDDVPGFGGFR